MKSRGEKIAVLKKIAHQLNEAGIVWALGASMLLYFKKVTTDFHDIDLLIANEDAERVKGILQKMGHLEPANPNPKYRTKLFLEFVIDGVDVDVMVGFAIVQDGEVTDCSLQREQIAEVWEIDGEPVPMQSVSLWREYYRLMGRTEKVAMIDQARKEK